MECMNGSFNPAKTVAGAHRVADGAAAVLDVIDERNAAGGGRLQLGESELRVVKSSDNPRNLSSTTRLVRHCIAIFGYNITV